MWCHRWFMANMGLTIIFVCVHALLQLYVCVCNIVKCSGTKCKHTPFFHISHVMSVYFVQSWLKRPLHHHLPNVWKHFQACTIVISEVNLPFVLILCLTASLSFHPPTGRMVHRAIKANNSCLQVQVSSLRRVSAKTSWVGCAKNKVFIARCRAFYIFLPKGNIEKNRWTCPWISVKKKRNSLYYPLGNNKGGQGRKRETETTLLLKQLPSVMTFWKTLTLLCLRGNLEQPAIKNREKTQATGIHWHFHPTSPICTLFSISVLNTVSQHFKSYRQLKITAHFVAQEIIKKE